MPIFTVFVFVLLALVVITIVAGVKMVPQGHEFVVQRLGKYHQTLKPGLNIILPYIDQVAYRVMTMDEPLDIERQEAITADNAVIWCNAIAFIKVLSPEKAMYGISDYKYAIRNLVMTNLRAIIGNMTLNEALSSRDKIKALLKSQISDDVVDWGLVVKSVEIQDIRPSDTMQEAMEKQAGAARLKAAAILAAEGEKQAMIQRAEGTLEAARMEAEAQIILADASAKAIKDIADAVGDNDLPAMFLLGNRYIEGMRKLAESSNAKMMVLPADIMAAVGGLINRKQG
ncbi:MAG: SPFH/Band 7/PHB domain protein [Deltaproteobacteria bacterium]|nr:SPFH/Band 7/PHB domain protein [Deltaproteobacteria bacterium]